MNYAFDWTPFMSGMEQVTSPFEQYRLNFTLSQNWIHLRLLCVFSMHSTCILKDTGYTCLHLNNFLEQYLPTRPFDLATFLVILLQGTMTPLVPRSKMHDIPTPSHCQIKDISTETPFLPYYSVCFEAISFWNLFFTWVFCISITFFWSQQLLWVSFNGPL